MSKDNKILSLSNKDKKGNVFNKYKIYHIVWRDAYSEVDEWHSNESLDSEDYVCQTIGYLVGDGSKSNYYTIASTITIDDHFCCLINIPKSMVISKKRVTINE